MKDAIPNRVEFQAGHVDYRIPIAQHVVPLKELMQNNPVKEAAQP
jgi:hypothetical protein